jgi:hypothetical protein
LLPLRYCLASSPARHFALPMMKTIERSATGAMTWAEHTRQKAVPED